MLLVQESHLLGGGADEASASALRLGWKTIQSPALPAQGKGFRGGVMVLGRSWLGISEPADIPSVIVPGRAEAAVVEFPGCPPFLAVSAYLHSGEGLSENNLQLLEDIGRAGASSSLPMLLGADFNMSAAGVFSSGFPQKLGCKLLEPALGTCKGRGGISTIDFFACELNLANGIKQVESVAQEPFHLHRPVGLTLGVKQADVSYWAFEVPFSFPKERLVRLLLPPPEWEGLLKAVEQFVECAPLGDPSRGREAVDKAYASWARLAELELASVTGHSVPLGRRASTPSLVRDFSQQGAGQGLGFSGRGTRTRLGHGHGPRARGIGAQLSRLAQGQKPMHLHFAQPPSLAF